MDIITAVESQVKNTVGEFTSQFDRPSATVKPSFMDSPFFPFVALGLILLLIVLFA